ncbi:unnamed protein product [Bursaphelenchus xylophilus]|uniref:(pine wood nematode) hypothetical protein n=1 Tax=Bursaphelenchus xylophilus TaxID=6326 RepID=A0A1I7S463_BURXY|nr:unnamed protein product [Bursaphelenchus xylophilus]CAG9116760.1 unnamed protein product [Bursaphelenchus xylophilus]
MSPDVRKSGPPESLSSASSDNNISTLPPPKLPALFKLADKFNIQRHLVACVMCEFFCSFFLMYGGSAISLVQTIQSRTSGENNHPYGIAVGWGLWLLLANYIGSQISGPHMNPAFSLLFYWVGQIEFKRVIYYSIAQFFGFFAGSLLCFLVYFDAISDYDGGIRQVDGPNGTAGAFATYPRPYLSIIGAFMDQLLTTGMLALIVLAVSDDRNKVPKGARPAIVGIGLWCIVSMWSHNCGAALNPARDFGPRFMTLVVGYGWGVISYNNYTWFWIPIVAPMFGSILGYYVYNFFLGEMLMVNDLPPVKSERQLAGVSSSTDLRMTSSDSVRKPYVPA